jgi:hypothetical protein
MTTSAAALRCHSGPFDNLSWNSRLFKSGLNNAMAFETYDMSSTILNSGIRK